MSSQLEITKDIVVAAIEHGIIRLPDASYKSDEQWSELNERRAKEVGKYFKIIAQAVSDANSKNFSFE